jgi:uncharacterized membrane protein YraQ (UPF0718 family)
MLELATKSVTQVLVTFAYTWPYLVVSVLVASVLKVHVEPTRLRAWLARHQRASVMGAIGLAVLTPLCSCGTMALVLAMLATSLPWAPIVAFMVASPLTSPGQLLFTAGLLGWPFAGFHFAVAILLGFTGAATASVLESRGWLANQMRLARPTLAPIAGGSGAVVLVESATTSAGRPRFREYGHAILVEGRRLMLLFVTFAFVGYLINNVIPATWVTSLFGSRHMWGVPLAATFGLPLYVNSEASLPLVKSFSTVARAQEPRWRSC